MITYQLKLPLMHLQYLYYQIQYIIFYLYIFFVIFIVYFSRCTKYFYLFHYACACTLICLLLFVKFKLFTSFRCTLYFISQLQQFYILRGYNNPFLLKQLHKTLVCLFKEEMVIICLLSCNKMIVKSLRFCCSWVNTYHFIFIYMQMKHVFSKCIRLSFISI